MKEERTTWYREIAGARRRGFLVVKNGRDMIQLDEPEILGFEHLRLVPLTSQWTVDSEHRPLLKVQAIRVVFAALSAFRSAIHCGDSLRWEDMSDDEKKAWLDSGDGPKLGSSVEEGLRRAILSELESITEDTCFGQ